MTIGRIIEGKISGIVSCETGATVEEAARLLAKHRIVKIRWQFPHQILEIFVQHFAGRPEIRGTNPRPRYGRGPPARRRQAFAGDAAVCNRPVRTTISTASATNPIDT